MLLLPTCACQAAVNRDRQPLILSVTQLSQISPTRDHLSISRGNAYIKVPSSTTHISRSVYITNPSVSIVSKYRHKDTVKNSKFAICLFLCLEGVRWQHWALTCLCTRRLWSYQVTVNGDYTLANKLSLSIKNLWSMQTVTCASAPKPDHCFGIGCTGMVPHPTNVCIRSTAWIPIDVPNPRRNRKVSFWS